MAIKPLLTDEKGQAIVDKLEALKSTLDEAPKNGKSYMRNNGAWVENEVENAFADGSEKPVQSKVIKAALDTKDVEVESQATPTGNNGATYDVKQGGTSVGKVEIPITRLRHNNAFVDPVNGIVDTTDHTYTFQYQEATSSHGERIVITPKVGATTDLPIILDIVIKDNIIGTGTTDELAIYTAANKLSSKAIDAQVIEVTKPDGTKEVQSVNIPTTKAIAEWVLNKIGDLAGSMVYMGIVDDTHILPSTYNAGSTYVVAKEGTYAGYALRIGDMLIANGDSDKGGTWTAVQPTPKVDNKDAILNWSEQVTIANIDGKDITVHMPDIDEEIDGASDNAVMNKAVYERTGHGVFPAGLKGELADKGLDENLTNAINILYSKGGLKQWTGTQAQYDALGTYDANTLYYITE